MRSGETSVKRVGFRPNLFLLNGETSKVEDLPYWVLSTTISQNPYLPIPIARARRVSKFPAFIASQCQKHYPTKDYVSGTSQHGSRWRVPAVLFIGRWPCSPPLAGRRGATKARTQLQTLMFTLGGGGLGTCRRGGSRSIHSLHLFACVLGHPASILISIGMFLLLTR